MAWTDFGLTGKHSLTQQHIAITHSVGTSGFQKVRLGTTHLICTGSEGLISGSRRRDSTDPHSLHAQAHCICTEPTTALLSALLLGGRPALNLATGLADLSLSIEMSTWSESWSAIADNQSHCDTAEARRFLVLTGARSGSSLLTSYLRGHPHVTMLEEMLSDDGKWPRDATCAATAKIVHAERSEAWQGLNVTPEQLQNREISLINLVERSGVSFVILLWRRRLLEQYASLSLPDFTLTEGACCSSTVVVDRGSFAQYCDQNLSDWQRVAAELCRNQVSFISVEASELVNEPHSSIAAVFHRMRVVPCPLEEVKAQRQLNERVEQMVSNWSSLLHEHKFAELHLEAIIEDAQSAHAYRPENVVASGGACPSFIWMDVSSGSTFHRSGSH